MVAGVAWAGCSASPDEAGGGADAGAVAAALCERPSGVLSETASLVGMTGEFAFTMVDGSGGETPRTASGSLALLDQEEGLGSLSAVSTPLYGTADIDLEAVGAHRVGELSSDDAYSPGVLVMEDEGPDGPRIRLRLGSIANTRDLLTFDGGYTILTVQELDEDGFTGTWRSAAQGPLSEGWFCAQRASAGHAR